MGGLWDGWAVGLLATAIALHLTPRPWKQGLRAWGQTAPALALALSVPLSRAEMTAAVQETVRRNRREDAYIRLVVTRGAGDLGIDPRTCPRASVIIILVKRAYHGQGIIGVLNHDMMKALKEGGYTELGGTWISDSNKASLKQAQLTGLHKHHRLALFEKSLIPPSA